MVPGTPLPAPRDPAGDRAFLGLLCVAALTFGTLVHAGTASLSPTARDQVHDLSLALRLREGTALSDGNRHPLFPALLAPVARRAPAFFDDACLVASVVAGLAWAAVGLAAGRVAGAAAGLVVALGVVLEFRLQARRVCPEPLLAGLLAVAAARTATAGAAARPLRAFGVAGGVLGLAWLTKGSALLSVLATLATVATTGGARRARRVGAVLLGFVVVASPLLVWNVAHGRSPVFNVNSAHVMWEDAWDVELDARSTATPASYLARHGVEGALRRLGDGLRTQRGLEWVAGALVLVAAGAFVRRRRGGRGQGGPVGDTVEATVAHPVAPTAGDAVEGPGREARRAFVRLAVAAAVVWGLAMAWYAPVVASRRLLFPVFPVLLTAAVIAAADLLRAWGGGAALRAVARVGAAAAGPVAAGLLAWVGFGAPSPAPAGPRPTLDPASLEAAAALRALPAGTRVVVRPSRTAPPDWLYDDVVEPVGLPAAVADADVAAWLRAHADAVLLGDGLFRHRRHLVPGVGRRPDGTFDLPTPNPRVTSLAGGAYLLVRPE
ncbi:MAG: hypothetical protein JNM10_06425 [Planctomycetia bacterium]|nr:hypothetical protein [Planctomycetia bacterium]